VDANVTVLEFRRVNVTCTTDYSGSDAVTFTWTSRSHPDFKQTGPNLRIDRATSDVAGDYECTVRTAARAERKWAPMRLVVLCKLSFYRFSDYRSFCCLKILRCLLQDFVRRLV